MVLGIIIPIICFYFYRKTNREMKEQDILWLATGQVPNEAIVTGEIKSTANEKQKFYHSRYIYVQELKLQTETKLITVKKTTPITKDIIIEPFHVGEKILIYGRWQDQQFYCSHFKIIQGMKQKES